MLIFSLFRRSCREVQLKRACLGLWVFLGLLAWPLAAQAEENSGEVFEKEIRPILARNCFLCHNPQLKTAGLDLSTSEGFGRGGQSGPVVSASDPASSRLLEVIGYQGRIKMPPPGRLTVSEIAALTAWVGRGAPWPGAERVAVRKTERSSGQFTEEEKNYWAFRSIQNPIPPKVKQEAWPASPIDRFILAKLEGKGLRPAPAADRLTLLRRASYDLIGLPPTDQEIAQFLADDSADAFERVMDRLLASPRYGERWGRHWLDVARYADSTGNDEDHRYPYAWRYRDYVIEAFNSDLPYDRFVQEQIAGDLLPPESPGGINRRGIVATGFLALGPKAVAQQDKKKMLYDVYDEQLDVTSQAFLGVTLACSRCHDHKFDPFSNRDYYSMISIFASTKSFRDPSTHVSKLYFRPLVPDEEYDRFLDHRKATFEKRLEIEETVVKGIERHDEKLLPHLADYMLAARAVREGGAIPRGAAQAKNLREDILQKWVSYLKPREDARPHLEEWRRASTEKLAQAAQDYQKRFLERSEGWRKTLEKWRKGVRKRLEDRDMPPRPKPKFRAERDPFFHDVYFNEGPFALSEEDQEAVFTPESSELLSRLRRELGQLEASAPPEVDMACAVAEGEIVQQKIFIRGDHNNPGEEVSKNFPRILRVATEQPLIRQGSGRLELARWLTDSRNPLTARVMVNRIWKWHFGEGLVRTPNNFGKMGDPASHPELIDYLARRFIDDGWSVKKMQRLIMLSSTYQMSGETRKENIEADPENRLLSRFNRRRLDVEQIRDGLLAMDGTLDLTMGGTLQSGFGTDGENSNDRLSLDPEKINRRLVYIPLRRANLPGLLNLFDFGDATTSAGTRPRTNVAPQALFMMNSEFIAARSRNLAEEFLKAYPNDPERRVERAYLRVLNRSPQPVEVREALGYVDQLRERFPDLISDQKAFESLCHLLIASNEFIYVE